MVGLKINQKKTEVMTLNIATPAPVKLEGKTLRDTTAFTYLGSVISNEGGAGSDIKNRLSKARSAFMTLQTIWKSTQFNIRTKINIYCSCVLSTLLYRSECWRMTEQDMSKLSTFPTTCLRKILRMF
uniref:DUF6451 domain-containing protein n=1 Tax=Arion vulgaris TaxID=1028688 RepID=A0A0B7BQ07_9EUPU